MSSVCDTVSQGFEASDSFDAAEELTASSLASILAGVLAVDEVDRSSHFFHELGADSMVMARFCARVRKRPDLPDVAMRDVYATPTIAELARSFAAHTLPPDALATGPLSPDPIVSQAVPRAAPKPASGTSPRPGPQEDLDRGESPVVTPSPTGDDRAGPPEPGERPRAFAPVACGIAQVTWIVVYGSLLLFVPVRGYEWIAQAVAPTELYTRSLAVGLAVFLWWAALPVLLKWTLIGRWTVREIPIWSLAYLRFWIVRTAIRSNPMALFFAGSPLYLHYLRILGARVGAGAVILTRQMPVCTDLLTIGAGAVIRKDTLAFGYRAVGRVIQTGPITLERDTCVGEFCVLDIGTSMRQGSQLGHSSSLHEGQEIPAGERWHGTPGRPGPVGARLDASAPHAALRRFTYSSIQVLILVLAVLPLISGVLEAFLSHSALEPLLHPADVLVTQWVFYVDAAVVTLALYLGTIVVGLLLAITLPRLLALGLTPGRIYPLYGLRYSVHRGVSRLTNIPPFTDLFGDSSYIVGYLGRIGYRLRPVEQTGSNFGMRVKHDNPYLCEVGSGTMVADGLSIVNAEYSATAFRLHRSRIGAHSFLGNYVVYPSDSTAGDNVLLATKVAVPRDGPVRSDVGFLGSPAFEIPRTVQRDQALGLRSPEELRQRLLAKNRHNLVTIALHLLLRWARLYGVVLLAGVALELFPLVGFVAIVGLNAALLAFNTAYWIGVDRVFRRLQLLVPQGCSIYDRPFWGHERYWKCPQPSFVALFDGTPVKPLIWRALGVRVGRGLFDDGCVIAERAFVTIGDDCTLGVLSILQCHSQEDGAFKSERTSLGSRCTVGVGALVHYGVCVGDDVVIAPDSFVMKGEEVPDDDRWSGNPARSLTDRRPHVLTTPSADPVALTAPSTTAGGIP